MRGLWFGLLGGVAGILGTWAGGYLADRYLGQRKAVLFGGVLLAAQGNWGCQQRLRLSSHLLCGCCGAGGMGVVEGFVG